jgi:hypothetical protein
MAEIEDGNNAGMIELGKRAGFAGESFGEGFRFADFGRQDFQGHEAVKLLLAGFIYSSHSALAEKLYDFELGELPGQFGRFGRHKSVRRRLVCGSAALVVRSGGFFYVGAGRQAQLYKTLRTKTLRRIGPQFAPTLFTTSFFSHYIISRSVYIEKSKFFFVSSL